MEFERPDFALAISRYCRMRLPRATGRPCLCNSLCSHGESDPVSCPTVFNVGRQGRNAAAMASGSVATAVSSRTSPSSLITQTEVVFVETSKPAKWGMRGLLEPRGGRVVAPSSTGGDAATMARWAGPVRPGARRHSAPSDCLAIPLLLHSPAFASPPPRPLSALTPADPGSAIPSAAETRPGCHRGPSTTPDHWDQVRRAGARRVGGQSPGGCRAMR